MLKIFIFLLIVSAFIEPTVSCSFSKVQEWSSVDKISFFNADVWNSCHD